MKKIKYPYSVRDTFFRRNKFFCISSLFLVISLMFYISSRFFPAFADFASQRLGGVVRFALAWITSFLPFSLAEAFLLLLFPLSIIFLFFAPDESEGRFMSKNSYISIGVFFSIISIYLTVFAPCYFRTSVGDEMGLDRENVTNDDIYNATLIVSSELEKLEESVTSDHTGKTLMPYSYSELVEKLNVAYSSVTEKYDFISNFYSYPKPLIISPLMPYTRISGFYTFFSGEANISTAYPDFMLPFTMAHEMAHQRGIAREDEANFIAFLVCLESDDSYIRYSGYTELMNYLTDDLYMVNPSLYNEVYSSAPLVYKREYSAYVSFALGTDSKKVSSVTNAINNSMLQSQGQVAGSESYNLVTELTAAYYKAMKSS